MSQIFETQFQAGKAGLKKLTMMPTNPWLKEVVMSTSRTDPNRSSTRPQVRNSFEHIDEELTSFKWLVDLSGSSVAKSQQVSRHQLLDAPASSEAEDLCDKNQPENQDYNTNPNVKPPFSYNNLIFMAMRASGEDKIRLSSIYRWIVDNFPYFRYTNSDWQNAIRHNLSVSKRFMRVARQKDERRKGGYWTIDPQFSQRHRKPHTRKKSNPAINHQPKIITTPTVTPAPPTITNTNINITGPVVKQESHQHQTIILNHAWNTCVTGAAICWIPKECLQFSAVCPKVEGKAELQEPKLTPPAEVTVKLEE